MSPSEKLIMNKIIATMEDDYSKNEAIIHVANLLGLTRKRVTEVYMANHLVVTHV